MYMSLACLSPTPSRTDCLPPLVLVQFHLGQQGKSGGLLLCCSLLTVEFDTQECVDLISRGERTAGIGCASGAPLSCCMNFDMAAQQRRSSTAAAAVTLPPAPLVLTRAGLTILTEKPRSRPGGAPSSAGGGGAQETVERSAAAQKKVVLVSSGK